jgi:single-strand DNA-binding protein
LLNRVVLIGRLTKDPVLRYTPAGGVAVTTFTLAVDRRFRAEGKQREADFIPVVVWQKDAENCANYLVKGRMVAVEGRLQLRSYEDREGQRRNVAEVVAEHVQFLDSRRDKPQEPERAGFDESLIGEDDIPF